MDKAALRPLVLDILKRTPQTHFHAIENDLRKLNEDYERQDVLALQEVLWELLVQGVLAPGKNSLNLNLPFVHLTEYGSRCLDDGRILVHDPDRYVQYFSDTVGGRTDAIILRTLREAVTVFLSGSESAALILLARCAELLFDWLADALATSGESNGQIERLKTTRRFSQSQARAVQQAIEKHTLPSDLSNAWQPQLNGLLALMQFARGEDDAPRWPQLSRDQLLGFFMLLPEQCAFAYHLMEAVQLKASS